MHYGFNGMYYGPLTKDCYCGIIVEIRLQEDDMKTFQEWSDSGYKILKGSKATWVDGVPMFGEDQVVDTRMAYISYSGGRTSSTWDDMSHGELMEADCMSCIIPNM